MPYEIRGKFVYNTETGEKKNKKPLSHERALRYMRALYAVEGKSYAEKAAITKQEADGAHPASHYLIVDDPQSPSTWHLRVRNAAGALDTGLMGGAWAALHGGYRGNRYEGPGKEQAIKKLTALYAEQQRPVPGIAQKAANPHAKAGETIVGNLKRGADGKFSSAGAPSTAKPESKKLSTLRNKLSALRKPKAGGKAPAKPKAPKAGAKPKASPEDKAREKLIAEQQKKDEQARRDSMKRQQAAERLRNAAAKRRQATDERKQALLKKMQGAIGAKPPAAPKGGGGGGGSKGSQKKPEAKKPETPAIDPALSDMATKLSRGEALNTTEQDTLVRNGLARRDRDGALILSAAGLRSTRKEYLPGTLTVYKDAGGWRWIGVSSTAFRDREGEIVSTAALEDDVARSYKAIDEGLAADHGPLRFWHLPGLDLGRCDFRMVHGHSLIEGGTFFSEKEASLIKPGDQMSLAFAYAPADFIAGVFRSIVSFERSITPAGRAANPFTAIRTEG